MSQSSLIQVIESKLDGTQRVLELRQGYFVEIVEVRTGRIWRSELVLSEYHQSNLDLPKGFLTGGYFFSCADAVIVNASPIDVVPPEVLTIGEVDFINISQACHIPSSSRVDPSAWAAWAAWKKFESLDYQPSVKGLNFVSTVQDESLILGFERGREVAFIETPHGYYVEFMGAQIFDHQIELPDGYRFFKAKVDSPWMIEFVSSSHNLLWRLDSEFRAFKGPIADFITLGVSR